MWGGKRKLKEFIDKTAEQDGTEINRESLMAIQGFIGRDTVFNEDGSITETNEKGETRYTTFNGNIVTEVFTGEKTITKTTTFNDDGSISEVIS